MKMKFLHQDRGIPSNYPVVSLSIQTEKIKQKKAELTYDLSRSTLLYSNKSQYKQVGTTFTIKIIHRPSIPGPLHKYILQKHLTNAKCLILV